LNVARNLIEGLKMAALFGAVALVVWSMPEAESLHAQESQAEAVVAGTAAD
jgi:hypothetical protein